MAWGPLKKCWADLKKQSSQQAAAYGNHLLLSCVRANRREKIWLARAATPDYTVRTERFDSRHGTSPGRLPRASPTSSAADPGTAIHGGVLWRLSDFLLEPRAVIPRQSLYQPW